MKRLGEMLLVDVEKMRNFAFSYNLVIKEENLWQTSN